MKRATSARLAGVIQKNEKQARHDSMHDALTSLGNRVLFSRRVNEFGRSRSAGIIAVLFIDLDDFKTVNDSLGHERGDQLLQLVAERLLASVRDEDLVARLSGDEFAILVESAVDRQDAVAAARRVQEALSGHVMLGDRNVTLSAIALSDPLDGEPVRCPRRRIWIPPMHRRFSNR